MISVERKDFNSSSRMCVSENGTSAILAGRRQVALLDLNYVNLFGNLGLLSMDKGSKYDAGSVAWIRETNRTLSRYFAISFSTQVYLYSCTPSGIVKHSETSCTVHRRSITDLDSHWYNQSLLLTSSMEGALVVWDTRDLARQHIYKSIDSAFRAKWSRESEYRFVSSHGGDICLWDIRNMSSAERTCSLHTVKINSLDWSSDKNHYLLSASQDTRVKLTNLSCSASSKISSVSFSSNVSACIPDVQAVFCTKSPVWNAQYVPFCRSFTSTSLCRQFNLSSNSVSLWNVDNSSAPLYLFSQDNVIQDVGWTYLHDQDKYALITWSRNQQLRLCPIDASLLEMMEYEACPRQPDFGISNAPISTPKPALNADCFCVDLNERMEKLGTSNSFNNICVKQQDCDVGDLSSDNDVDYQSECEESNDQFAYADSSERGFNECFGRRSDNISNGSACDLFEVFTSNISEVKNNNIQITQINRHKRECQFLLRENRLFVEVLVKFASITTPPLSFPELCILRSSTQLSALPLRNSFTSHWEQCVVHKADHSLTKQTHTSCLRMCRLVRMALMRIVDEMSRQPVPAYQECGSDKSVQTLSGETRSFNNEGGQLAVIDKLFANIKDVNIPCVRTSGACFTITGVLVTFACVPCSVDEAAHPCAFANSESRQLVHFSSDSISPIEQNTYSLTEKEGYEYGKYKSILVPNHFNTVSCYDTSQLSVISRTLAEKYIIEESDFAGMCLKNAQCAREAGRYNLEMIWKYIGIVGEKYDSFTDVSRSNWPWAQNVLARNTIVKILNRYLLARDVQTVTMLCCALSHRQTRPAKNDNDSNNMFSLVSTHCDTSRQQNSLFGAKDEKESAYYNRSLFTRSNSWTYVNETLNGRHEKTISCNTDLFLDNQFTKYDLSSPDFQILDLATRKIYDKYICAYANILHSWQMFSQSILLMHHVSSLHFSSSGCHMNISPFDYSFELRSKCGYCTPYTKCSVCFKCKRKSLICCICETPVFGLSFFCPDCGHGGHQNHLGTWFRTHSTCAVCKCSCISHIHDTLTHSDLLLPQT